MARPPLDHDEGCYFFCIWSPWMLPECWRKHAAAGADDCYYVLQLVIPQLLVFSMRCHPFLVVWALHERPRYLPRSASQASRQQDQREEEAGNATLKIVRLSGSQDGSTERHQSTETFL